MLARCRVATALFRPPSGQSVHGGRCEVEQAIANAVVVELAEVGFGRLTFDSVASVPVQARARCTGGGLIRRRW